MSEERAQSQAQSQEPSNRATVALVDAKVALVGEKVDGLRNLIETEFANIRSDVKPLFPLVVQVALLEHAVQGVEKRTKALEAAEEDRERAEDTDRRDSREFRRVHLPTMLISLVFMVAGLGSFIYTLAH